jgi:hypothetical protein
MPKTIKAQLPFSKFHCVDTEFFDLPDIKAIRLDPVAAKINNAMSPKIGDSVNQEDRS